MLCTATPSKQYKCGFLRLRTQKSFWKKNNNKQTKRWTGHGLIVIRGKVKTIKLRERNDKTRKTAAALADILNTRDTVSVIWRRRQQISEDDFQANPQELWSWVRRLNFPRVCQKRGQKRRCKNFLVFPVKKKLIELRCRDGRFKMFLWTPSKCSDFWSGNKVLSW